MLNRIEMFGLKITKQIDRAAVPAIAKIRPAKTNTHRAKN